MINNTVKFVALLKKRIKIRLPGTWLFIWLTVAAASGQDVEYARRVIGTLASPRFAGRGYVAGGNDRAAAYLKRQYARWGLKPFGKDYEQPFEITVNTFPSTMRLLVDGVELVPGEDYLVDPASPSFSGTHEVYVADRQDLLDDSRLATIKENAAGKILILDGSGLKTDDGERIKQLKQAVGLLKQDTLSPIVAVIEYSPAKLTWYISKTQAARPAFTVKKELDLKNVRKIGIRVKARMTTCETRNIVGYIEGAARPDSFLTITAHYDHIGMMGKKACFHGANDNASGVSMLLNLAKHFAAHPHKYSIAFIATSAEEVGIVGAKYFTEHPLFELERIRFLVNFDMAGGGDEGIQVVNGSVYQELFDRMTKINGEKHYLPEVRIRGESCNSDHCPFYQKGVPAFFIYTLGGSSAYHDIHDRSETLPLTAFANYFRLAVDFFNTF
ncbi:MAG: M20/M25/M40 family metallo-hydrolase [Tannerella sp.]|jgi:hypothetical protein|nr:M20/M25/M40 family metallo-hydrolase [Tannerella sp.]